jgi:thiol-disulfide isomerase/thioredoxin
MKAFKLLAIILLIGSNKARVWAQQKPGGPERLHSTYITGKITTGVVFDTLSLALHGPFFTNGEPPERHATQVLKAIPGKDGQFEFKIPAGSSPFHVSLFLSSKKSKFNGALGNEAINDYLIEPGDSIHVIFDQQVLRYSGKGAGLFQAQQAIEQIDKGDHKLTGDPGGIFRKNTEKWLSQKDSLLDTKLAQLNTCRSKITATAYGIVRADIIGANRAWVYRRVNFEGPFFVAGTPLEPDLANLCTELQRRAAYIDPDDRAALSPKYVSYLYDKLRTEIKYERVVNHVDVFADPDFFPAISAQYTGILRDKLLAYWLIQITTFNKLRPEYMNNALSVMQNAVFIQMVQELKATFTKGMPVTDFRFKDASGKTVHLADLKGKVLLVDLWFSGCTGCVAVAAGLPMVEDAFTNRADVAFVSISVDKDKRTWLKSIDPDPAGKSYTHYTTPATIYWYTGGTAGDNAFIRAYVPSNAYPSLLIIDKTGKLFSPTPSRPVSEQGRKDLIKEISGALVN